SRALRSAIVASGAWSEPAWTWDSPREERTNTSQSGHAAFRLFSVMSLGSNQVCIGGVLLTLSLFLCIGGRGFANPGTIFVCCTAVLHALDVARAFPFDDGHKFVPVQFAEVIVTALFIPFQIWIRQRQSKSFGLRN